MASKIIKMVCLTNMHAGNGDVNYNIVDNEVERDPVTGYPTVNSSGVKGALREFFKGNNNVDDWFGKEGKENTAGKLKILAAEMLAIPARVSDVGASNHKKPYQLVTTENAIERLCNMGEVFGVSVAIDKNVAALNGLKVENLDASKTIKVAGVDMSVLSDSDFESISLPVLARNSLDDKGISKNLWYEEVVPHESVLYFAVTTEDSNNKLLDDFVKAIDKQVVQFGGNASIGYGLCKLTVM